MLIYFVLIPYVLMGWILDIAPKIIPFWKETEEGSIFSIQVISYIFFALALLVFWAYFTFYLVQNFHHNIAFSTVFASIVVGLAVMAKDSALFRG